MLIEEALSESLKSREFKIAVNKIRAVSAIAYQDFGMFGVPLFVERLSETLKTMVEDGSEGENVHGFKAILCGLIADMFSQWSEMYAYLDFIESRTYPRKEQSGENGPA